MMAEEADQDLLPAHISTTHIPVSEYERDTTWKPFFLKHDDNQGAITSTPDGRTARQTEKMTRTTGEPSCRDNGGMLKEKEMASTQESGGRIKTAV